MTETLKVSKNGNGGRPTLKDVAAASGVSLITASRVLSGYPHVGLETRNRVMASAQELGYRTNMSARSLRTAQSFMLGMYAPDLAIPFYHEIVLGARAAVADEGYRLLLEIEKQEAEQLQPLSCDGYLVVPNADIAVPLSPEADEKRTVCILNRPEGWESDLVTTDYERVITSALRHLAERGYRRVALMTNRPVLDSNQRVINGYTKAVKEFDLEQKAELILHVGYDTTSIERAVVSFCNLNPLPDALIVHSVSATLTVVRALRKRGVRPGKDIGFIGAEVSRTTWADLLDPALTNIRLPGFEMGATSARRLIERLRGIGSPPALIELPAELVLRDSTPPLKTALRLNKTFGKN
jgi:LacI family transcriptional regulator